jgi:hypothetical protein
MLLVQIFKTLEGAQKRAAFENAHSAMHRFRVVRCHPSGAVDTGAFACAGFYVWRSEKELRK